MASLFLGHWSLLQRHRGQQDPKSPILGAAASLDSSQRRRAHHPSCRSAVAGTTPSPSGTRALAVELIDLSERLVTYEEAWRLQKELVELVCKTKERQEGHAGAVLLLQHPPVYTLGAGSTEGHLRFDPADSPLPLYRTERGGEVTYHGPGQLVMYPILNLHCFRPDLHWYLRSLEEVVIRALAEVSGLRGEREAGLTGVWVGGAKVAAIGVRASRWVTYHGLALNVTTDLGPFEQIVPCGIADRGVTSVLRLLGGEATGRSAGSARSGAGASSGSDGGGGGGLGGSETGGAGGPLGLELGQVVERQLLEEYSHGLLHAFEEVFGVELRSGGSLAAAAARSSAG